MFVVFCHFFYLLLSYTKSKAFIITRYPTPEDSADFLRTLLNNKSDNVISMEPLREIEWVRDLLFYYIKTIVYKKNNRCSMVRVKFYMHGSVFNKVRQKQNKTKKKNSVNNVHECKCH